MGTSADGRAGAGRRVGILGGTFDPPHLGHLIVAAEARWRLDLDEVRLMPARTPPHKPGREGGTPAQRARWAQALAEGGPGMVVSHDELMREGPSYTADTLAGIAAGEPDADLWFLMGSDQLERLPAWERPHQVTALCRLGVVPRGGHGPDDVVALGARVAPGRVDLVDAPRVDISSSLIRARIARGLPVRHLMPAGVARALADDGLLPSIRLSD